MIKNLKKFVIFPILLVSFLLKGNSNDVEIIMLDVGQGECIFLRLDGNNIIIDGGSNSKKNISKNILLPFLKSNRVSFINYWFITHCDNDHISGLMEILLKYKSSNIKIKNIVIPYRHSRNKKYYDLERYAKLLKIRFIKIKEDDVIKIGFKVLRCLYPSSKEVCKYANLDSINLLLSFKNFKMLFTGDLENIKERKIIKKFNSFTSSKITVLKVAHHGSNNATSNKFLKLLQPKYALISAGINNRYGHPNKHLLNRLYSNNVKIYTTINSGAILLKTNGYKVSFYKYKN